ncbi:MAG: rhomboid family intramembrane serine protease [Bacteriovoracia bacterium]
MPIRLTKAVKALCIAIFVGFLFQHIIERFGGGEGRVITRTLGLVPGEFINHFWIWQIFTYPFLHADVMHLFLNLLMLVFVGAELEAAWGTRRFLRYYFFCAAFAGFCYLAMQVFFTGGLYVPMVGASGGIYGLLMAYGLVFGERTLLFMMLFPMKAKQFIWILAGVQFMTAVFSPGAELSAVAHLGGMAGGFAFLWIGAYLKLQQKLKQARGTVRTSKRRESAAKKPGHLKLVVNKKTFDSGDDGDDKPKTWH